MTSVAYHERKVRYLFFKIAFNYEICLNYYSKHTDKTILLISSLSEQIANTIRNSPLVLLSVGFPLSQHLLSSPLMHSSGLFGKEHENKDDSNEMTLN